MSIACAPPELLERVSEVLARETGLRFAAERRSDLQRALANAAVALGFDQPEALALAITSQQLPASQLQRLTPHLTVGETYFFRDRAAFGALGGVVLPELVRRHADSRRLRLWSAACSTGEEAYSLAILIEQVIPNWQQWDITLLATDLNEVSLDQASAGIYTEWSFRECSAEFKQRYFVRLANGRYALTPRVKERVSFSRLNLAKPPYVVTQGGTQAMDLILCRNLLMYFTPRHTEQLVASLHESLSAGGYLLVAPSEYSQTLFHEFATVNLPGTVLYCKRSSARVEPTSVSEVPLATSMPRTPLAPAAQTSRQAALPALPLPPAPLTVSAPELPKELLTSEEIGRRPDLAAAELLTWMQAHPGIPAAPALVQAMGLLARALANQGRPAEALLWSERWISADKSDAAAYYLQASILQEQDDAEGAKGALQRALYVQPRFALAHFALANLARAQGHNREAQRHLNNTLQLLRAQPGEQQLAESDGLTAAQLAQMAAILLGQLERRAG